jgi:hypothetical protein
VAFPESRRDVGLRDVIGEVLRDERKHQERGPGGCGVGAVPVRGRTRAKGRVV